MAEIIIKIWLILISNNIMFISLIDVSLGPFGVFELHDHELGLILENLGHSELVVDSLDQRLELLVEVLKELIVVLIIERQSADQELESIVLIEECKVQQNPVVHDESQVVLLHDLVAHSLSVSVGRSHYGDQHVE